MLIYLAVFILAAVAFRYFFEIDNRPVEQRDERYTSKREYRF